MCAAQPQTIVNRGVEKEMLTRGKLAARTGCNAETIRYYEKTGLLPDPQRNASGYRMYDDEHVRLVMFIQRARALGFSAERLRDLLGLSINSGKHTRAEVKNLTQQHIEEISDKIKDLQKLKKRLTEISSHCDGADATARDCPILISLFEQPDTEE